MEITPIHQFQQGHKIQGFYLCIEKNTRNTKNGNLYLDIVLSDSTGKIRAKVWDKVDYFIDKFEVGQPLAVKGIVSDYNSQLQLTISNIKYIADSSYDKYGFSTELLQKTINQDIEALWKDITNIIKSIKQPYKKICSRLYLENKDAIISIPASIHHHHQIRGGFLLHVYNIIHIAKNSVAFYPTLDADLVTAGLLLHNIGKVKSMTGDLFKDYSDEGHLMGYAILGRDMVRSVCATENISADIKLKLEHIILSHQGNIYHGSAIKPMFPEALLVHDIDNLDAGLSQMVECIGNDPHEKWTNKQNPFHRPLKKK